MNIQRFKYLVALAEHRHFGKAAKSVFISQPALSMLLKKWEDELGILLLERTNRKVMLTPAGEALALRAKQILNDIQALKHFADSIKNPFEGEIRLGLIPTIAPYWLPYIMPAITKSLPKCTFQLIEEKTSTLVNALENGQIDAAILATPVDHRLFQSEHLYEEVFFLAVSKKHHLSQNKSITQQALSELSLLLLSDGHCLRDQALSFCDKPMLNQINSFAATSLETLRHMVAINTGATYMPALAKRNNDGIAYLSIHDANLSRQCALVYRHTSPKQAIFKIISEAIRKALP